MELWTAFILGLFGSLHCAGMCGPLALALPPAGSNRLLFFAGRAAYNLGRLLMYCVFGVVFGLAGHTLWLAGVQRWASIALGVALLAGLLTSRKLPLWRPTTAFVNHLKSRMSTLLRKRSLASLGLLGFLNGLLPCGLVYVACAAAITTGTISGSVQYMAAFGAGTVPLMLAISLSGKLVPPGLRLQLRKAIPLCVVLLAGLLILRGLSLGIPYLSPDLSANSPSCCHR